MIVDLEQEVNPDYSTMSLDELLGEDSKPRFTCASMDEIRGECARRVALDALLTIQERMCKGMCMIKDMQRLGFQYGKAKDAFNHAKEVMFADDSRKPQAWWNRFNQLKHERDAAWSAFSSAGGGERMRTLWAHWVTLKDQGCMLANEHNLWPEYFKLQNEEITAYFTYGGDVEDQSVDSRHMDTVEAFAVSHQEEMDALRLVEETPFTIPVRNSGYVPVCKDVSHEYMSEEEVSTLMASCPF